MRIVTYGAIDFNILFGKLKLAYRIQKCAALNDKLFQLKVFAELKDEIFLKVCGYLYLYTSNMGRTVPISN